MKEDKQDVKKLVEEITKYECPVCKKQYLAREEAEKCATPREPKFKVGDWVSTNKSQTMAVPGGDEFSREYEDIRQGSMARIARIYDENQYWGDVRGYNVAHPEFVYSFDKGEKPMIWYGIKERFLQSITGESLNDLVDKAEKSSRETSALQEILKDIGDNKNET